MTIKLLKEQFAVDFSCSVSDLENNFFVTNKSDLETRYWARDKGSIVCFNGNLFVRTENEALTQELQELYQDKNSDWFFEMDNLEKITTILKKYELKITRLAPFFVPKDKLELTVTNDSRFVFFNQEETQQFKVDKRITEAFCYSKTDPDQLGLGFYEDNVLQAVCGANRIGKYTWELGIEILNLEFEGQGIAAKLIQNITAKIQQGYPDVLPVYGTAFSHVKSINVALNAGFKLGWSELMIGK